MRRSILIVALFVGRTAAADNIVLAVDGGDIYVDLGADDGVGVGAELELDHEVIAKDPRSGATLHDRFALGTLVVIKSGDKLSLARAPSEFAKRVLAGDHVQLVSAKKSFVDPWKERIAASKPAPAPTPGAPVIDHAELARAAWQDTLGAAPEKRIQRWTALIAADPDSPYRKAIEAEITNLRSQITSRDKALELARSSSSSDRDPRIMALARSLGVPAEDQQAPLSLGPVDHAVPGRALDLAFVIRAPDAFDRAWMYVRASGEPGFKRHELVRDGDAYLRTTVPGALVHGSHLDWYVEIGNGGTTQPVLGSQNAPRRIEVDQVVREEPIASGRSHVTALVDYVDFDGGLNKGYDQYYQAELGFTYRFIDPIYAVSVGFGTLSGTGGPHESIDNDPTHHCIADGHYDCKEVTFSYVYTELEHRFTKNVALLFRPQVGLLTTDTRDDRSMTRCQSSDIEECSFVVGLGFRGRLRFGEETGTNLVIGGGFTRGVGTLLEASYHWLPAPILPVQLAVQVTDQPVIEGFGVRLIGDVGLKKTSWFYPSARVSYQARTRDHAGVSGGLAMNFDW